MIRVLGRRERGAWLIAFIAGLILPYLIALWQPVAYTNVEVVEARREGGWLYLTATFEKKECERVSVVFLGDRLGLQDDLTSGWQDLNGVTNSQDRTEGRQTLRGRLHVGELQYEYFEIRTRHLCDGRRVDGVFLHVKNDEVTE